MTPNPGEMIVVCRFGEEGTAMWNDTSWGMAYTVVDSGEAQHGLSVRFWTSSIAFFPLSMQQDTAEIQRKEMMLSMVAGQ